MKTAWWLDKYRNCVGGDAIASTVNTLGEISVNGEIGNSLVH